MNKKIQKIQLVICIFLGVFYFFSIITILFNTNIYGNLFADNNTTDKGTYTSTSPDGKYKLTVSGFDLYCENTSSHQYSERYCTLGDSWDIRNINTENSYEVDWKENNAVLAVTPVKATHITPEVYYITIPYSEFK